MKKRTFKTTSEHLVHVGARGIILATVGGLAITYLLYTEPKAAHSGGASGIKYVITSKMSAELTIAQLLEWLKWLAGIEVAAIAAVAVLIEKTRDSKLTELESTIAFACLTAFGGAVMLATFLAGFLPSVTQRLAFCSGEGCDVFAASLVAWRPTPYVGPALTVEYSLFALGCLVFTMFAHLRLRAA